MKEKQKGKLIVIEGSDGSGKTTQLNLLKSYLKQEKIPVETIDFPRYRDSFHGKTVEKYLKGEFGNVDSVSPYLISLAYSLDRAAAKGEMNKWLKEGKIILANRYATSNMAHQAAKLPEGKRGDFLKWEYELEYKVNKIPKENLVIYLHVPVDTAKKLTKKRGIQDSHEKSHKIMSESEKMYERLSSRFNHWVKIDCVKGGILRSKEDIHKEVVKILKDNKII
jgi:dTMP kinase